MPWWQPALCPRPMQLPLRRPRPQLPRLSNRQPLETRFLRSKAPRSSRNRRSPTAPPRKLGSLRPLRGPRWLRSHPPRRPLRRSRGRRLRQNRFRPKRKQNPPILRLSRLRRRPQPRWRAKWRCRRRLRRPAEKRPCRLRRTGQRPHRLLRRHLARLRLPHPRQLHPEFLLRLCRARRRRCPQKRRRPCPPSQKRKLRPSWPVCHP